MINHGSVRAGAGQLSENEPHGSHGLSRNLLRQGPPGERDRVTTVELFFDLVFVLAVTQFADILDARPNLVGVAQTVILLAAVWWVWVYTAWATNWLDPETQPVRWWLLTLMLLALILSESIPRSFDDRAALFVGSYLAFGLLRTLAVLVASARVRPAVSAGQRRILAWSAAAAPFWIGGAITSGDARLLLWAIGLLIEYLGPATLFWLPGAGRSSWKAWQVSGAHFAERSSLFILIALGESIVITGGALTEGALTAEVLWAFGAAFTTTLMLWLLYFAHGEKSGTSFIRTRDRTGPVARMAYTYLHLILILGIILTSHGGSVLLHDPQAEPSFATSAFITLGPALYLVGDIAFKRSVGAPRLPAHLFGTGAFVLLLLVSAFDIVRLDALGLAWTTAAILIAVVAIDEQLGANRRRHARAP